MRYLLLLLFVLLFAHCSDHPKELSDKTEIVDLAYIQWACDCARFVDVKYLNKGLDGGELAAKCIFIEASAPNIEISEIDLVTVYRNKTIRLTGQYYTDKGIPDDYVQVTDIKPEYARVFRYTKVEFR